VSRPAQKIAFFGLPLAALLLAKDGHDIVWAGICRRDAPGTRRLARCVGRERVHVLPGAADDRALARLGDAPPDLIVSWFWTRRIPRDLLRLAPAFGVHPSLLPRHRGADPYFWAIDSGDDTTGVTAHLLDDEYDTGPILGQRALRIDPSWDAGRLAHALDGPSLALMREVARAFAEGRPPVARPQDDGAATVAPEPADEDLAIRWSWPAWRIERRVRAAAPWPGAWTEIGDQLVELVRVRSTGDFPRALLAGEAAVRADGVAVVRAGDDALELLAGRADADRPLSAGDLADLVERARTLSVAPGAGLRFDGNEMTAPPRSARRAVNT
jgi:methionyl-tRNA formyltransferase